MKNLKSCIISLLFINFSKCSKKGMEGKIVGGEYAKIVDFPHSVYLYAQCNDDWICGSSILNQMILLTAAHCLYGCIGHENYTIDAYSGHENLKKVKNVIEVETPFVHQEFAPKHLRNDIGFVVLKQPLILGDFSKRVMIKQSFPAGEVAGTVAGWGLVDDDTWQGTLLLKNVRQKILDLNYVSTHFNLTFSPGVMAAGSLNSNADRPSEGDSGSALVTPTLQQIGLVSFKVPVHRAVIFYTNVSYYYSWIEEHCMLVYCHDKWED